MKLPPVNPVFSAICAIFLIAAPFIDTRDVPHGFFTFIRIITFTVMLWMAAQNIRSSFSGIALILAVVFNPFIPIHFNRKVWAWIDILAAITIAFYFRKRFIPTVQVIQDKTLFRIVRLRRLAYLGLISMFAAVFFGVLATTANVKGTTIRAATKQELNSLSKRKIRIAKDGSVLVQAEAGKDYPPDGAKEFGIMRRLENGEWGVLYYDKDNDLFIWKRVYGVSVEILEKRWLLVRIFSLIYLAIFLAAAWIVSGIMEMPLYRRILWLVTFILPVIHLFSALYFFYISRKYLRAHGVRLSFPWTRIRVEVNRA